MLETIRTQNAIGDTRLMLQEPLVRILNVMGAVYNGSERAQPVSARHARASINESNWTKSFLGRACEQRHDFPKAIAAFEQALKLDQDHAEIWSDLGYVLGALGNMAEVRKVLAKLQTPGALSLCRAQQRRHCLRGTRRHIAVLHVAGTRLSSGLITWRRTFQRTSG